MSSFHQAVEKQQTRITEAKAEPWVSDEFTPPLASGATYNRANAYTLARVCSLVWEEDKSAVQAISELWGLKAMFVDLRATHTQYVIAGNKDFTVLAFRATQGKFGDYLTVLKYKFYETNPKAPVENAYAQIPSGHAGFRASAAEARLAGLIEDIKLMRAATGAGENAPLFITGHSLGAGVALLTRPYLEAAGLAVDSVYLYGTPITISDEIYQTGEEFKKLRSTTFFHRYNGISVARGLYKRWEHDNVPRLRAWSIPYSPPGNSFQLFPDGHLEPYPTYQSLGFFPSTGWAILWLSDIVTPHNLRVSYLPALKRAKENPN